MTTTRNAVRGFLAHKGRMALSGIAVLLSVAFVCGTLVFTDTMNTTFDKLFATTSADVTVSPEDADAENASATGVPPVLPAGLVADIERAEGVASAEGGVFSTSVTVVDADKDSLSPTSGAPTIVGNWTDFDARTMEITDGAAPHGSGQVMVDADTADKHGLALGDAVSVIGVKGTHAAEISGIAAFTVTNPGAAVFYFDTPTAQKILVGEEDVFTDIHVTAADGRTDEQVKKNVTAALAGTAAADGGYKILTADEAGDQASADFAGVLDVMKYAMLGFALLAALVGVFLIFNTFSMLVTQRTREIGLMRAVGSSRKQVNQTVLAEALILGVVGSALGVGAGIGLAVLLMEAMGAMGMNLSTDDLTVAWTTPVAGVVLGVVVTLVAAYLPARRASKVSPMAALRDPGMPADARAGRIRLALGTVLTLAGAAALHATTRAEAAGDGSQWLGLGIVTTLVGFIVIGPVLASGVVRVLGLLVLRLFGPVGRMAERNALRNPRRTGATGAALMIGLALVACLSVVGSSMVASATDQLDKTVGTDFIIQSPSGQLITPQAVDAVRGAEGIDRVTEYKLLPDARITMPDGRVADKEWLNAADPSYARDLRTDTEAGDLADAYEPDSMSVFGDFADKYGLTVGSEVKVDFPGGGTGTLTVRAITSDEVTVDKGALYLSVDTAAKYIPAEKMPLDSMLFAGAEDGQEDAAYTALKAALDDYPQYQVMDRTDYKEALRDQMGQMLNIVYALLALAVIVAVLGVVNTLALSVIERTREIGLMRAIGLSRRQLRRMIRLESVVIALFGALLGLGLGMGWGAAAQQLLALEGLTVLEVPWPTILGVFAGSAVVGLLAALAPAHRAGRMNVLGAIATE
ncbi:FtsX-like permease family protein [Streptomyces sp. MJP52]|uniref:ABC transporter permease n=1 Tax=Streptomyces sp. MJP52 TaxID=2940555 RepID=UPI0024732CF7|nr:FtsX-like permease family protein [Streptomyces sp. MJP52]MDH6226554.1 putative ABC transport system permease protein [Streptomyces sp. MJP52]